MTHYNSLINYFLFLLSIIICLLLCYYISFEYNKLILKSLILITIFLIYFILSLVIKKDAVLNLTIFLSFFNISIATYFTNSTNIIILLLIFSLLIKSIISVNHKIYLILIRRNPITKYLFFLVFIYTISLFFAKKDFGYHIMFYHGIISSIIVTFFIISVVNSIKQIKSINKIFLFILILNISYSIIYIFYPQIDFYKSEFFSLEPSIATSDATRLQGLTFRGEAYGEYLMACSIYLVNYLIYHKHKSFSFLLLLTIVTIATLIGTQLRGANLAFIIVFFLILTINKDIAKINKLFFLFFLIAFYSIIAFSYKLVLPNNSLISRTLILTDNNVYYEGIPKTRYYTWIPALRFAKANNFLGVGPSLKPYIKAEEFTNVKKDGATGKIIVWPHNVILLILCTVGFYGLIAYIILFIRVMLLKKVINTLNSENKPIFEGYFFSLIALLIEFQKYDGILRTPDSSLYLAFPLVGLLFSLYNFNTFQNK